MTKNVKITSFMCLNAALMTALVVAANNATGVQAASVEHTHSGNHYSMLASTETTPGTAEYWACCSCHEHYLSLPDGTWSDAGVASYVDSSDDRYIAPVAELIENLENMGFGNVKTTDDGTVSVGKYRVSAGGVQIIIPEGVTKIDGKCFTSDKIEWIVFPSTLETMSRNSVSPATNTKFYFTGVAAGTKEYFNCKGVWDKKGQGWDFVDGIPTSK